VPVDAYSVLTTIGTILLLASLGAGVYVWLTYSRWSELRFRDRHDRLRSYEIAGALRERGDPVSNRARRSFLRALALFAGLIAVAVFLLELREVV
jgi:hypothetical protein